MAHGLRLFPKDRRPEGEPHGLREARVPMIGIQLERLVEIVVSHHRPLSLLRPVSHGLQLFEVGVGQLALGVGAPGIILGILLDRRDDLVHEARFLDLGPDLASLLIGLLFVSQRGEERRHLGGPLPFLGVTAPSTATLLAPAAPSSPACAAIQRAIASSISDPEMRAPAGAATAGCRFLASAISFLRLAISFSWCWSFSRSCSVGGAARLRARCRGASR